MPVIPDDVDRAVVADEHTNAEHLHALRRSERRNVLVPIGHVVVDQAPARGVQASRWRCRVDGVDPGLDEGVPVVRLNGREAGLDILARVGDDDRIGIALAEESTEEVVERALATARG